MRFTLRKGVKFHETGAANSTRKRDLNLDKVLNDKAPQFDKRQSGRSRPACPRSPARQIDDDTVEITTKKIDSFFPYQIALVPGLEPAQYEKLGKTGTSSPASPPAPGPFKLTKLVRANSPELTKNEDYWNKKRIPKTDRLI